MALHAGQNEVCAPIVAAIAVAMVGIPSAGDVTERPTAARTTGESAAAPLSLPSRRDLLRAEPLARSQSQHPSIPPWLANANVHRGSDIAGSRSARGGRLQQGLSRTDLAEVGVAHTRSADFSPPEIRTGAGASLLRRVAPAIARRLPRPAGGPRSTRGRLTHRPAPATRARARRAVPQGASAKGQFPYLQPARRRPTPQICSSCAR